MKFFSHDWAAESNERSANRTVDDYASFIRLLPGATECGIVDFVNTQDLRGALIDKLELSSSKRVTRLFLVTGDNSVGYHRLCVNYNDSSVATEGLIIIGKAFESRYARIRYDEFDRGNFIGIEKMSYQHRFLLWPKHFGEISIHFTSINTSREPLNSRAFTNYGEIIQID